MLASLHHAPHLVTMSHTSHLIRHTPAADRFVLEKHQIVASSDAVLLNSSKILVLWLIVPQNREHKSGFESFDEVRRRFYCFWAPADKSNPDKTCPFLKSLFDSTQLVLPLNLALEGLLPPADGGFPVAISKTRLVKNWTLIWTDYLQS